MIDKKKMIYKIVGGIFYVIMILVLSFICWKMEHSCNSEITPIE